MEENNNYASMMAVVSGDSDGGDLSDEDIISLSDNNNNSLHNNYHPHSSQAADDGDTGQPLQQEGGGGEDLLYDENLDAEDEAYVYNNLRGGQADTKRNLAAQRPNNKINPQGPQQLHTTTGPVKPRNSDAVLSCPCCFTIVCMDSQRHERYHNQYRAMFVMSIEVDWQHRLQYDDQAQGLVRWNPPNQQQLSQEQSTSQPTTNKNSLSTTTTTTSQIVAPDHPPDGGVDPLYYAVSCANCHTMVAALDMNDEVYHFYDCLASA